MSDAWKRFVDDPVEYHAELGDELRRRGDAVEVEDLLAAASDLAAGASPRAARALFDALLEVRDVDVVRLQEVEAVVHTKPWRDAALEHSADVLASPRIIALLERIPSFFGAEQVSTVIDLVAELEAVELLEGTGLRPSDLVTGYLAHRFDLNPIRSEMIEEVRLHTAIAVALDASQIVRLQNVDRRTTDALEAARRNGNEPFDPPSVRKLWNVVSEAAISEHRRNPEALVRAVESLADSGMGQALRQARQTVARHDVELLLSGFGDAAAEVAAGLAQASLGYGFARESAALMAERFADFDGDARSEARALIDELVALEPDVVTEYLRQTAAMDGAQRTAFRAEHGSGLVGFLARERAGGRAVGGVGGVGR